MPSIGGNSDPRQSRIRNRRASEAMIACTDVHYRDDVAIAAAVLFHRWDDNLAAEEIVEEITHVRAYEPGKFYLRELPCLLKVLQRINHPLETVIVDGYVRLGCGEVPGLGEHLYDALQDEVPVVGVAKSLFRGAWPMVPILRGRSRRPLYISAAGMDLGIAAERIRSMHGPHRIPTLLKRVDVLCRRV
jgi:deoxyribonuclease V